MFDGLRRYLLALATFLIWALALTPVAEPIHAQSVPSAAQRFVSIDFDNVDLNIFIKYISELTGKNFVVDPSVQGQVTILSPTKISESDAYQVFESVLEIHGYTTVPSGSITKIVPLAAARSQNVDIVSGDEQSEPGDRVVTQLIALRHSSPQEITQILKPLISKTSVIVAHTQSGMLIITDTKSNIKRLAAIIETLDVPDRREQVAVIALEHGNAGKVGTILQTIFQRSSGAAAAAPLPGFRIIPYERINALVVLAEKNDIDKVRGLVSRLDVATDQEAGNIHVVYLQNATALEMAKVLSGLPRKDEATSGAGETAAISEEVNIMADEETNALIVTASKAEFKILKSVIEKLDIPRRMVYLEALIMEVNIDKNFEVGVQWFGGDEISGGDGIAFGGFSAEPPYGAIQDFTNPESPFLPAGLSLGVLKQGIEIGGITFPNIAAILRAYRSDEDINIIATPQILTTDNKRAEISVGENVPFITSQNTTAGQQDYTQFEYKDVATKLRITPHIGQANTLRLEIETEVVKLKGNEESLTPTTFRRTAQTTVVVENSDTIVIGGIIGQDGVEEESKVPGLGDIPLLGWLFKTRSIREVRTNMFIFVTPRIVENPAEIARVSQEKEGQLGAAMEQVKKELFPGPDPLQAAKLADRGFGLLRQGEGRRAREFFTEVLKIDPGNPYALINLGTAFELEGDYDQAIGIYEKLIESGSKTAPDAAGGTLLVPAHLVEIAQENLSHAKNLRQK